MSKLIENQDERILRDHFAGLAMQGQLSRVEFKEHIRFNNNYKDLAQSAYKIADAMIKERKDNNNE